MARLFDRRDIEFLRNAPGYTRLAEAEFRRRRRGIFRGYLDSMRAEFSSALEELEDLAEEAPGQEWPGWTWRCRLQFEATMITAHIRQLRYRWNLGPVQLSDVVQRFDTVLTEIRRWIPQAE
jgi:hypothetical protein